MLKKRYNWLDVAKGIVMIAIVLGHTLRTGVVRDFVYAFHVPCFFFLSGITAKEKFSSKQLISDAKRLLIPYFAFGLISIVVYALFGSIAESGLNNREAFTVWDNLIKLIYCSSFLPFNAPLYFLPCLFATKLYHLFITTFVKNRPVQFCISVAGSVFGFIFSSIADFSLPFSLELMLKMYPFFLLGKILAKYLLNLSDKPNLRVRFLVCAVISLLLTGFLANILPSVNYTNNDIQVPLLFYVVAVIGICGIYCLSVCLQNAKWLLFLGKRTMAVLTMHKFPIVFFQIFGPLTVVLSKPDSFLGVSLAIICTAVSIVLSLAIGYIIELYFPLLLGIQKQKES